MVIRRKVVTLFIINLGACATTGARDAPAADVGVPLPALQLKTLDGHNMTASAFKGKVVLLDIWASWCAPCKEELPILNEMAPRLRAKGIEIVAVSVDEAKDDAVRFLEGHGAKWSLSLAHDPDQVVASQLKPSKMPTSYVVDRGGIIRYVNSGFERSDAASIEARLTKLAAQR